MMSATEPALALLNPLHVRMLCSHAPGHSRLICEQRVESDCTAIPLNKFRYPAALYGSSLGSHTPSSPSGPVARVSASTTAWTVGLSSSSRSTKDQVQHGVGLTMGRAIRPGGTGVWSPFGFTRTGLRSLRTCSKNVGPVTPPPSTRSRGAPISSASCSANRFHDSQLASSASTRASTLPASTGDPSVPTSTA